MRGCLKVRWISFLLPFQCEVSVSHTHGTDAPDAWGMLCYLSITRQLFIHLLHRPLGIISGQGIKVLLVIISFYLISCPCPTLNTDYQNHLPFALPTAHPRHRLGHRSAADLSNWGCITMIIALLSRYRQQYSTHPPTPHLKIASHSEYELNTDRPLPYPTTLLLTIRTVHSSEYILQELLAISFRSPMTMNHDALTDRTAHTISLTHPSK